MLEKTIIPAAALALAATLCADGVQRPFSLYQPIVDRAAFGPPPDDPTVDPGSITGKEGSQGAAAEELSKQQQELLKSVTVCAINSDPDGSVMVGFVDNSDSKSPRSYYLKDGDERDGWLVASVDQAAKKVVLRKDSVDIECTLGKAAGGGGAASAAAASAQGGRSAALPGRSPLLGHGRPGMSRRAMREQQEQADRQAQREAAEEMHKAREEARAAREEADRRREEEREAMQQSLLSIREEMRRNREEIKRREAEEREAAGEEEDDGEDD